MKCLLGRLVVSALIASLAVQLTLAQTPPMRPDPTVDSTRAGFARNAAGLIALPAGLTGEALKALVQPLINSLNDLGANLVGDAGRTLTGTATQLGGLMNQLDDLTHRNLAVPLESLGMDVRSAAGQLYAAVTQLSALLDRQRQCIFLNLDLFTSGVATVGANLRSGIPFVTPGDPYVSAFRFESKMTANIVPLNGGRFTVSGFHLWTQIPPIVRLKTSARDAVIATLNPEQSASADAISLTLPDGLAQRYAGQCLQLEIEVHERQVSRIFRRPRPDKVTNRYLPLCIPQAYSQQFKIKGWVDYATTSRVERELGPDQEFRFDNCSCNTRSDSRSNGWPVPSGWSITRLITRQGEMRNTQNTRISYGWSGNIVTASGTVDGGSCAPFRGCYSSAIYQMFVRPVIAGDVSTSQTNTAESASIPITLPQTLACLDIPKSAVSERSTFWVELIMLVNGQPASQPFYASPRKTTNMNADSMPVAQAPPFQVEVTFNPQPVNGKAQVCATLTNTQQCGY